MTSQINLDNIKRRLYRSILQDGLTELLAGLVFMILGLGYAVHINSAVVIAVVLGMPLVTRLVVEPIKKRYVYPRMGYVSLKQDIPAKPRHAVWIVIGLFLAYIAVLIGTFLVTVQLMGYEQGRVFWYARFPPAIVGVGLSALAIIPAYRFGINRWYPLGVLALVGGFAVPYIPGLTSWQIGLGVLLECIGIVTGLVGLMVLLRFVRANPVIDEEVSNGSI